MELCVEPNAPDVRTDSDLHLVSKVRHVVGRQILQPNLDRHSSRNVAQLLNIKCCGQSPPGSTKQAVDQT